ncbi:MAG: ABC transporter ATP-binding protein [Myxococcota bacterium]|nr:ABC transporter ATP-binding protein [Myxococcota bacterium]
MSEALPLSVRGLHHRYPSGPAVARVDLDVHAGEFVALLGPSGSGKTTLLRAIAGLLCPTGGEIRIRGERVCCDGVDAIPTGQRQVGLVFQDYALFPHMTVRQNVAFGLKEPDPERTSDLLARVDLTEHADRLPARLSGGQQQRAALARALAPRPALLLLDEPFANMDVSLRDRLGQELQRLVREEGTCALLVTHDQHSALALADRVVVLEPSPDGGFGAQQGPPTEIYQRPATRRVAQLTGPCHFLQATARGDTAQTPLGPLPLLAERQGDVTLILRPHQLRFEPSPDGNVVISTRHYTGRAYHLVCETPTGDVEVEWPATSSPPEPGSRGRLEASVACWALPDEA